MKQRKRGNRKKGEREKERWINAARWGSEIKDIEERGGGREGRCGERDGEIKKNVEIKVEGGKSTCCLKILQVGGLPSRTC